MSAAGHCPRCAELDRRILLPTVGRYLELAEAARELQHPQPVAEGDIDGEAHAEGVHRERRLQQQRPVDPVATQQPA